MCLVRVGYRTINLEYLIEAVDSILGAPPEEAPPGKIRVSIYPGKIFDIGGAAADDLRIYLEENSEPPPAKKRRGKSKGDGQAPPPAKPKGAKVLPPASSSVKSSPIVE